MTPMTMTKEDLRKLSKAELKSLLDDIRETTPSSIHVGYLLGRLSYKIESVLMERELAHG